MSTIKKQLPLGELLRQIREKDFSLTLAAARLRIDPAILSKMERGERKISRKLISKFASLYETDEKELIVKYLAEKIVSDLEQEKFGTDALKLALKKIRKK